MIAFKSDDRLMYTYQRSAIYRFPGGYFFGINFYNSKILHQSSFFNLKKMTQSNSLQKPNTYLCQRYPYYTHQRFNICEHQRYLYDISILDIYGSLKGYFVETKFITKKFYIN
jgi:hypothetical protein